MKKITLTAMRIFLLFAATICAATPSQMGMYEPECPEKLKKFKL